MPQVNTPLADKVQQECSKVLTSNSVTIHTVEFHMYAKRGVITTGLIAGVITAIAVLGLAIVLGVIIPLLIVARYSVNTE